MDEEEVDGLRSPIKRLGSTRKLLVFNNIRLQLNEQLRCLDVRMEAQVALVAELQDFFRKRAELELDYSKSLDKMAKSIQLRHKEQKQKREQWPLFSSYACWQQLVNETKSLSRDHAALSEVYSTHLVGRLNQVMEDVQRIYRRCREIGYETHEEILRVLHELHTTMKTYQAYQAESKQAETKLRVAEQQRTKLEIANAPPEKLARSKKYKLIEKEVNKRKAKYTEAKLKALKARNEYILCLEASNTTIHKYFVDDLSDLIDCMDFGFHNCIARALMMHCSAEEGRQRSLQTGAEQLAACVGGLDSRADKQRFLESHHAAFMIPKKFEFAAAGNRERGLDGSSATDDTEPELQKLLHAEMEQRLQQLQQRITSLRTESEEVWKTLETAEASLLEMLTAKDYDCSRYFGENALPTSKPPESAQMKLRADRHETEEFYLSKFREYLLGSSRIARLDAKQQYIQRSLLSLDAGSSPKPPPEKLQARRKRIGRQLQHPFNGQPKLFGGSLEEYLESTNQEIPLIIRSCIRVINLYGLHHQGIFRVSGSQVEINNFREWFERGEDPLADVTDASDINSVAGVLKLYLRELREPIFPIIYFEQLMELAQLDSKQEFVARMKQLVSSLPTTVVVVMRYLFAFLNHLSEFSDENMMDPYNLAICFGPTLVPVPEDKDQVQYQNQVNELIKNIITLYEDIFPDDIGGIQYEKYISREPDDVDVGDSPTDQVQEDMDSEVYPSEDESENMEATAQFDFKARSERELSFKKGDTLTLYTQVSNDWWRGALGGREGLIPDKYIMLKIKDEERDKDLKSSSSEESMRRRASSSADSVLSSNNSPLMGPSANTNIWPSTVCDTNMMVQSDSSSASSIVPSVVTNAACVSTSSQPIISREEVTMAPRAARPSSLEREEQQPVSCNGVTEEPREQQPQQQVLEEAGAKQEGSAQQRGAGRRQQWKSQSATEPQPSEELSSFSANRELWQRRAASHGQLSAVSLGRRERQKHAPDLVCDLPPAEAAAAPATLNSPVERDERDSAARGPESPDMSTAAERFAKQNQCTLKKRPTAPVTSTTVPPPSPSANSNQKEPAVTSQQCTSTDNSVVRSPSTGQLAPRIAAKFAELQLAGGIAPAPGPRPQLKMRPQILLRKPVLPMFPQPAQPAQGPVLDEEAAD